MADGLRAAAQRGAAVKAAFAAGVGEGEHGEGQGEVPGQLVPLGHAQGLAGVVPVGEEDGEGPDGPGGRAIGQGELSQQSDQCRLGVVPLVRGGGVGVLAGALQDHGLALLGAGDGNGILKVCGGCGSLYLCQREP